MSVIGKVIHTVLDRTKHAVFEKGTLIYRLNIPALRRSNRERAARPRPEGKIRIGFMLQPPTSWAVIESVYRAAAEDPDTEPVVILMPELEFRAYIKLEKVLWQETYAFGESRIPAEHRVRAYEPETEKWLDPATLNLDFIFIPRPYETYLPKPWRASALRKITRVCYVPYAPAQMGDEPLLYNSHFIRNVSLFFTENKDAAAYLEKTIKPTLASADQKMYDTGYPKYDLVKPNDPSADIWPQKRQEDTFRVLWTPRWTSSTRLGGNNFRRYHEQIIALAENDQSLQLAFRPHPLALDAYVREEVLSQEELDAYLDRYDKCPNAVVDRTVSYYDTFFASDVLVADITSLIEDYMVTAKPVVFCATDIPGAPDYGNDAIRPGLYTVHSWDELKATLADLRAGRDPKKELREKLSKELTRDGHIGRDILDILKKEAAN